MTLRERCQRFWTDAVIAMSLSSSLLHLLGRRRRIRRWRKEMDKIGW